MEYIVYNSETRQFSFIEDRYFAAKWLNEKQKRAWLKANGYDPNLPYDQFKELYRQKADESGVSLSKQRNAALKEVAGRNVAERAVATENRDHAKGELKQMLNESTHATNPVEELARQKSNNEKYHNALAEVDPTTGKSVGKKIKEARINATTANETNKRIEKAINKEERKYNSTSGQRATGGSSTIKPGKSKTETNAAVLALRKKNQKTIKNNPDSIVHVGGSKTNKKIRNTQERQGASKQAEVNKIISTKGNITPEDAKNIKTSTNQLDPNKKGNSTNYQNYQEGKVKKVENSENIKEPLLPTYESKVNQIKPETPKPETPKPETPKPETHKSKANVGLHAALGGTVGAGIGAATTIGMKNRLVKKGYSEEEAARKVRRARLIRSSIGAGIGALGGMSLAKHKNK